MNGRYVDHCTGPTDRDVTSFTYGYSHKSPIIDIISTQIQINTMIYICVTGRPWPVSKPDLLSHFSITDLFLSLCLTLMAWLTSRYHVTMLGDRYTYLMENRFFWVRTNWIMVGFGCRTFNHPPCRPILSFYTKRENYRGVTIVTTWCIWCICINVSQFIPVDVFILTITICNELFSERSKKSVMQGRTIYWKEKSWSSK